MKYMKDANGDVYLRAHDIVAFLNNLEKEVAPGFDDNQAINAKFAFTKTLGEIRLAVASFEKHFSGR